MEHDWDEKGWVVYDDVLTDPLISALLAEASSIESQAIQVNRTEVLARRDGSFASPARFRVHRGEEHLQGLLRDRDLLARVRESTGLTRLIPIRCGYNFYDQGDFMGVHRDEIRATVTLTFALTEDLGSTSYDPALRDGTTEDLVDLVETSGFLPTHGSSMPLPLGRINAFDGYNIPHWRPKFSNASTGLLANMIYFEI